MACYLSSSKALWATHYDTLGISRNASRKEIKLAFHKLSKIYHPDLHGTQASETKFADISAAYNTLADSKQRQSYDASLHNAHSQSPYSSYYSAHGASQTRSNATHAWNHFRKTSPHTAYQPRYTSSSNAHANPNSKDYDEWAKHFQKMQDRYARSSNLWGTQSRLREQYKEAKNAQAHSDTKTSAKLLQIGLLLVAIIWVGNKLTAKAEEMQDELESEPPD